MLFKDENNISKYVFTEKKFVRFQKLTEQLDICHKIHALIELPLSVGSCILIQRIG